MAGLNHCTIAELQYVFLIIQLISVVAVRDHDYFNYHFFVQSTDRIL